MLDCDVHAADVFRKDADSREENNAELRSCIAAFDSNRSPAWATREVQMDRAQRHSRYGGGGSRASSPSKRSRPQSKSQQGDGEGASERPWALYFGGVGSVEDSLLEDTNNASHCIPVLAKCLFSL